MAVTFDIPGGQATMIDRRDEVKPRRRREVELIASRVGTVVVAASQAARLYCGEDLVVDNSDVKDDDGEPVFSGDVHLTEHQLRMLARLNDAVTWALLTGWTLPEPLPEDPDALLDIDAPVFDALRQKAAELNAAMGDGGFTVDAVEDREAPTGD